MTAHSQSKLNSWLLLFVSMSCTALLAVAGFFWKDQFETNRIVREDHIVTRYNTDKIREHSGQIYDLQQEINSTQQRPTFRQTVQTRE